MTPEALAAAIAATLGRLDLELAVIAAIDALAAREGEDHAHAVVIATLRARLDVESSRPDRDAQRADRRRNPEGKP